jgi:uncharacterized repeat protein (TIGR04138 family)
MTSFKPELADVVKRDPRYAYEAYEFVYQALHHTVTQLGREPADAGETAEAHHHVRGPELLEGIRTLALQEFGLMARTVFRLWGIDRTDDFGEIVFNLIDAKLMNGTPDETRDDFHELFDLDETLMHGFRIVLEEE